MQLLIILHYAIVAESGSEMTVEPAPKADEVKYLFCLQYIYTLPPPLLLYVLPYGHAIDGNQL